MADWKTEHDAELMLRREWSARAQKAEARVAQLEAALSSDTSAAQMTERLIEAAAYYERAEAFYATAARRELSEAREAIEIALQYKGAIGDQNR
jgi:long-subunit fatty acid transport protein